MCSRYYVELSPELRPIIEATQKSALAEKMVHDLGRPVIAGGSKANRYGSRHRVKRQGQSLCLSHDLGFQAG